jgi:hypothetical protein
MWHIRAYKLATTYKMTLMYFIVNIHINNQSTLYKVISVLSVEIKHLLHYIVWVDNWCGCWLRSTRVSSYKRLLVCKQVCVVRGFNVTFNLCRFSEIIYSTIYKMNGVPLWHSFCLAVDGSPWLGVHYSFIAKSLNSCVSCCKMWDHGITRGGGGGFVSPG